MGDFNEDHPTLFSETLSLQDCSLPSFPNNKLRIIPGMKRGLDHIFIDNEYQVSEVRTLEGLSDHLLLYCDVIER